MWIDSDIVFDPADIDKIRSHSKPFTCGLYPKKGQRQFANNFLPGATTVRFGVDGGLIDILYCCLGITSIWREVFDAVLRTLEECDRGFHYPLAVTSDRSRQWFGMSPTYE
jgi:hypothetical protein